jgi:hypothetical protein
MNPAILLGNGAMSIVVGVAYNIHLTLTQSRTRSSDLQSTAPLFCFDQLCGRHVL